MKWIVKFFYAITFLTVFFGCSINQTISQKNNVEIIINSWSSIFGSDIMKGIIDASKQYNLSIPAAPFTYENNNSLQIQLINSAIKNDAQIIVLEPLYSIELQKLIETNTQTKFILLNDQHNIENAVKINMDYEKIAEKIINEISLQGENNSNILLLNCVDQYSNTEQINDALSKILDLQPQFSKKTVNFSTDKINMLENDINSALLDYVNNDFIIALNNSSAEIVIDMIKNNKINVNIKLFAFSDNIKMIEYLDEGRINALIVNNNVLLGYTAIKKAAELLKQNDLSPVYLEPYLVDKENLYYPDIQKAIFPID